MKTYRLILALLTLSLLFSGVQGQYTTTPTPAVTNTPVASNMPAIANPQYAEYYAIPQGSTPTNKIGVPQKVENIGYIPSTVYIGNQQQAVPYAQYQSTANYTGAYDFWIQGTNNWTQYAEIPYGSTVNLLAISPNGGNGYITDREPDGLIYSQNFYFYPKSQIPFYAAEIGQHILTFTIGNKVSNPIVIEVTGYYYPGYYQGYYPDNYNNYGYFDNYGNFMPYGPMVVTAPQTSVTAPQSVVTTPQATVTAPKTGGSIPASTNQQVSSNMPTSENQPLSINKLAAEEQQVSRNIQTNENQQIRSNLAASESQPLSINKLINENQQITNNIQAST